MSTAQLSFSIAIPTLNAEPYLGKLLPILEGTGADEIILVDSQSTDATVAVASRCPQVRCIPIDNFSHGRSRNMGAAASKSDIIIFLSQDALPTGPDWAAELLAPFADPKVAMTYSRQVPYPDANPMERFFLADRFPAGDPIRRELPPEGGMTVEDTFCSNVSSAIRRAALLDHPFEEELIMSEDQQLSRDLLLAGYAVVYTPASIVTHSHNYTLAVCLKRYFDSVLSLRELFADHDLGTTTSMGLRYLLKETSFIVRHHPLWLPYYGLYTGAKVLGALLAHIGTRLPTPILRCVSLHAYHWTRPDSSPCGGKRHAT